MPGLAALAVAGALLCSACALGGAVVEGPSPVAERVELPVTPSRPLPPCEWAEVYDVTDGDTVRVRIGGREERVRYIGIDAPELRPGSGPPQPFAAEATRANTQLVLGARICLEKDVSETDRFGRLLRYAWLEDGRLVNEILVAAGLAEAVRYRPDIRHHASILEPAQVEAEAADRGIWAAE